MQTAGAASKAAFLAFAALVLGAAAAAFGGSLAVQRRVAFVDPDRPRSDPLRSGVEAGGLWATRLGIRPSDARPLGRS